MSNVTFCKEAKQEICGIIKEFFMRERDEDISDFQAATILDFMLQKIGPRIYNQAINDAYQLMNSRIEDILALEKRPR